VPYCTEIEKSLDRDGELVVEIATSMDDDVTLYVRERDLLEMAAAFGYALVKQPTPSPPEGER
jgi:hypothetical protein